MKIPRSIQIMDTEIKIELDEQLLNKEEAMGLAVYRENKIILQPNTPTTPISNSELLNTLVHEITHFVLHKLHKEDLNDDEGFVHTFSSCFCQALKSGDLIN